MKVKIVGKHERHIRDSSLLGVVKRHELLVVLLVLG